MILTCIQWILAFGAAIIILSIGVTIISTIFVIVASMFESIIDFFDGHPIAFCITGSSAIVLGMVLLGI